MNILFDGLIFSGLLAPVAGIAFAVVRRRHRMWLQKGLSLKNAGRYFEAERLLANAAKPLPAVGLTETSAVVAEAKVQLCWLWLQETKDEHAVRALKRLKELLAEKAGANSLMVEVREALCWLYLQRGMRKEALANLDEALDVCKQYPDEFAASIVHASVLCTRGWMQILDHKLPAAGSSLRGAQVLLMSAVGAQSVHHLPVLMNLAWLELMQGDTVEANRMLAHALKTYGPVLGKWHPRCAHLLALLGAVAGVDGDWKSAAEYLQVAAKILRAHALSRTAQGQKITTALEFIANRRARR